ncbi:MAG: CRISPR-associated endonuclease Cas6 [Methanolinea sp.]|nr:CRISPR-associated endonuclease Cas6 [Methanolinea sp.]
MRGGMRIPLRYLVLHTDRPVTETGTNLRGYIAGRFPQYPLLHHHLDRPLYAYPMVQYKVIGGTPSILGILEGARVLWEITDSIDELVLAGKKYRITAKVTYDQQVPLVPQREMVEYRFVSPWLGLNQENYQRWRDLRDWREKKNLLNAILTGNLLSMAKGLNVVVGERLSVHSHLEKVRTRYKGVEMTGFLGSFRVNLSMPDYLGIGKGVSQGFGTVRRVAEGAGGKRGARGEKSGEKQYAPAGAGESPRHPAAVGEKHAR